jgi:hypothetical protein
VVLVANAEAIELLEQLSASVKTLMTGLRVRMVMLGRELRGKYHMKITWIATVNRCFTLLQ